MLGAGCGGCLVQVGGRCLVQVVDNAWCRWWMMLGAGCGGCLVQVVDDAWCRLWRMLGAGCE